MYKFDYDGWGEFYFVCSESPLAALNAVKNYIKTNEMYDWEEWENSTLENLPSKYSLKIFEPNEVDWGEYS